jgi:hypothetical protein
MLLPCCPSFWYSRQLLLHNRCAFIRVRDFCHPHTPNARPHIAYMHTTTTTSTTCPQAMTPTAHTTTTTTTVTATADWPWHIRSIRRRHHRVQIFLLHRHQRLQQLHIFRRRDLRHVRQQQLQLSLRSSQPQHAHVAQRCNGRRQQQMVVPWPRNSPTAATVELLHTARRLPPHTCSIHHRHTNDQAV